MGELTLNIRRKIQPGELVDISQKDRENISELDFELPDTVIVKSLSGTFIGQFRWESGNVRLLICDRSKDDTTLPIVLLQSIPKPQNRFSRILEGCIELGVEFLIPLDTYYDKPVNDLQKLINATLADSSKQSMTNTPTDISEIMSLDKIDWSQFNTTNKICLSTEPVNTIRLSEAISIDKPHLIAIGPPRGWHSSEIEYFKDHGFHFVNLRSNILRTDTAGVVVSSIIKYIQGEL